MYWSCVYNPQDLHKPLALALGQVLSCGLYHCQELGSALHAEGLMVEKDWEQVKLSCGTSNDKGVEPARLKQLQHQV